MNDMKRANVAGRLYDEYCKAVGGLAYDGKPLPVWHVFYSDSAKRKQANAWIHIAGLAEDIIKTTKPND